MNNNNIYDLLSTDEDEIQNEPTLYNNVATSNHRFADPPIKINTNIEKYNTKVWNKKPKIFTPPQQEWKTEIKKDTRDILYKKILCNNKLKYGNCNYGSKCMYAHSLSEQHIEPLREKVYNIIKSNTLLDGQLKNDNELVKTLILLTKVCEECVNKTCPGGYNCKYGACDKKYQICYNDLMFGKCTVHLCDLVHLSLRGFEPLKQTKPKPQTKQTTVQVIPNPTLLTSDFFLTLNNLANTKEEDDLSESEESIEQIGRYLNQLDDLDTEGRDPCDLSIFIK